MADMIAAFTAAARRVGAEVHRPEGLAEAAACIAGRAGGPILLPPAPALERLGLAERLRQAGGEVVTDRFRLAAPTAAAGVTGADFALADTGTVALESTDEAVRLATTLPARHFVLLDPGAILSDAAAALPLLRRHQQSRPRSFLAWITGPSRTADIERVLTIGVHGPKELHILLVEGIGGDFRER